MRHHASAAAFLRNLPDCELQSYVQNTLYADESGSHLSRLAPDICEGVRRFVADKCAVPLHAVVLVGSARLGFSTKNGLPFELGYSDLDVGIVNPSVASTLGLACRSSERAPFPPIRPDHYPDNRYCKLILETAKAASVAWADSFSAVSIAIYDDMRSLTSSTVAALRRWRHLARETETHKAFGLAAADPEILMPPGTGRFCMFDGDISDSSPVNTGPHLMEYEGLRRALNGLGNRTHFVRALDELLGQLGSYLRPEALLVGGSVLQPSTPQPRDLDCVLFYSALNSSAGRPELEEAMKRVRKFRQSGIDMRLMPADGPVWLTVKLAGYSAWLFSKSRSGEEQGSIVVALAGLGRV